MTDWTAPQLRELVRAEICAERRLRDALRADDRRWIDDTLKALDKALQLQAATYPTTADFNALKTEVDIELATRIGSSKGLILFFSIASGVSIVINVVVAFLTYARTTP